MKPCDNKQLTLFAWSDWLEEQGKEEQAEEVRDEVKEAHGLWVYAWRDFGSARSFEIGRCLPGSGGESCVGVQGWSSDVGGKGLSTGFSGQVGTLNYDGLS